MTSHVAARHHMPRHDALSIEQCPVLSEQAVVARSAEHSVTRSWDRHARFARNRSRAASSSVRVVSSGVRGPPWSCSQRTNTGKRTPLRSSSALIDVEVVDALFEEAPKELKRSRTRRGSFTRCAGTRGAKGVPQRNDSLHVSRRHALEIREDVRGRGHWRAREATGRTPR